MKRLLLAVALLANHALLADPAKAQEVKEVTLTVTPAELTVIGDALGSVPYAKVAPLMAKLQGQVVKQQQPVQPQGSPVATPENGK